MEVPSKTTKLVKFTNPKSNDKDFSNKPQQSFLNQCTNPALKIKEQYLSKQKIRESTSLKTQKLLNQDKNYKYRLLDTLSIKLVDILNCNVKEEKKSPGEFTIQNQSYFYSDEIPEIGVKEYFRRLIELTKAELSTCLLMSIYIDRFCEAASFHLTWNTIFR